MIVGAKPRVEYPQVESGPWAKNEYPEEPLIDGRSEGDVTGYEIDRPDVVSTSAEVEAASAPVLESSRVMSTVADNVGVARKFPRRW
jgi:hypothetical protein